MAAALAAASFVGTGPASVTGHVFRKTDRGAQSCPAVETFLARGDGDAGLRVRHASGPSARGGVHLLRNRQKFGSELGGDVSATGVVRDAAEETKVHQRLLMVFPLRLHCGPSQRLSEKQLASFVGEAVLATGEAEMFT